MGLKDLRDKIKKASKGIHVSMMSDSEITKRDQWLATPAYDLNRILCGDLTKGLYNRTWTLITGPEHSFKSSFMCLTMAKAQKEGYKVIVIDTEGAWDDNFVRRWGLDPEEVLFIYTPWVDEIKVALAQILDDDSDDRYAIVIDSIGGMDKVKIKNDAIEGEPKADQGGLQKELKPMYKLLSNLVKSKNSIAVASAHLFGKPTSYGPSEDIGGGKSVKLMPDIIVTLKKEKIVEKNGKEQKVVGNKITATTIKNRIYPPFNEAEIQIDFINGLNRFAGLAEIAVHAGILQKGGAGWYTYTDENGNESKYQGDEKVAQLFAEREEQIIGQLNEFISKTGFSTVNENVQLAFEMHEELKDEVVTEDGEENLEENENVTAGRRGRKKA